MALKFVTADVTAAFVNKHHGIKLQGPDFDKNTQTHSTYTVMDVEELPFNWCIENAVSLHFSISAKYLQKI